MIERIFQDIPDGKINEADQQDYLVRLGWSKGKTWDDLLQSKRILMISEAGAGKTYECQAQAEKLWKAGEPAFFIELADLAKRDVRSQLDPEEEERFDTWLSSQSDVATFFLDSIDELKLSLGSLKRALKQLKKCINGQLHRVRIVVTTRPIPFDEQLVRKILPVPPVPSSKTKEEMLAEVAMHRSQDRRNAKDDNSAPEWRAVALMPLSDEQIIEFARHQRVDEPEALLADLKQRNAIDFARRPQDLIELCADWREHKRIRTHRNQVASNVRVKLLPREDRPEPAELSGEKATEGASRLALAMQFTRRLTIRHSAEADTVDDDEAALDPAIILADWQPDERRALLERPLFSFATYGRVRFHHRSVMEYLAAERLIALRKQGMPYKALRRLLFAETKGKLIVRPSKRPIAGWIALQDKRIFELLRDNEPAVLLDEGDPESISLPQREQVLLAYVERYGAGGWRGLETPPIQVHRFASKGLSNVITKIWEGGVENPEVREVLFDLVAEGRIDACADIVFGVTQDATASDRDRIGALEALTALEDKRLTEIAAAIADHDHRWPNRIAERAIIRLFPEHMSVEELCLALQWEKPSKSDLLGLTWHLGRTVQTSPLEIGVLERLRDELVALVSKGLRWRQHLPHITSDQWYLSSVLAAVCERGLTQSQSDDWLRASSLALQLHHNNQSYDEPISSLRKQLSILNADSTARLFWIVDALIQSLHEITEPLQRYIAIASYDGPIFLNHERDFTWVCDALSDKRNDFGKRSMLLEAALRLSPNQQSRKGHIQELKELVADEPTLLHRLDEALSPSKYDKEDQRWKKEQAKREEKEKRKKAKAHASWVSFWREVSNQPEEAFSSKKRQDTAWNLWRAMRADGDSSRSSGWNRRLIEELFDKETADRLRRALMKIWREERPTLPSERAPNQRNSSLWQLGLAAIYAEAEDPNWAAALSSDEAKLAAHYAIIELNGLPQWMEDLAKAHPSAFDQVLGNELSWELAQKSASDGYSKMLQGIGYTSEAIARLFLPRLEKWLQAGGQQVVDVADADGVIGRTKQVTEVVLKHGDETALERLKHLAIERLKQEELYELRLVWLSILLRVDPDIGVLHFENEIKDIEPAERSEAVTLFATLFGDRMEAVSLSDERFTPQILLKLVRLAYQHVRTQDDAKREGSYEPDTRDNAETARNIIVTALFNAKGEDGLAAKIEMAADPLCTHFKDRILAVAEENWAREIDADIFNEAQAVALDQSGEAPPKTNEAMFAILKDRLSDLDELLLQDTSPREAWAGINQERVMRRAIARELELARNSVYKIDQEGVTADEKETDIRLRSTASPVEGVIELKLADKKRSARELRDTIEHQLVKKYMASENCRSGALLLTLSRNRTWEHPDDGRTINVKELITLLDEECDRVREKLGGAVNLTVHFLDLRPRLLTEKPK
ncbi:hypothetical protein PsW64_03357 [Pseudovibrio sp. W64]|uniref:NACHT domain-containing protein n=1 Tax=Pseudovibrio sp. W64 TaxID=1735583 RepID=UPI0007AE39F0|nr:ATP-binding protein [Pseudovibrio sp. W64]KZK79013.1 hypothetical protein PsW64_03357 [Pseudovibrio sp. W64]